MAIISICMSIEKNLLLTTSVRSLHYSFMNYYYQYCWCEHSATCLISFHVIISNMVPCSNNHIDWVEVFLINESHGNFTPSSSQQRRISCFPVPHCASISWSGIHVCPIRSDQYLITRERKGFWSVLIAGSWEWYCTIGVHLAKKNVSQFQCSIVKSILIYNKSRIYTLVHSSPLSKHCVYKWLHTVLASQISKERFNAIMHGAKFCT